MDPLDQIPQLYPDIVESPETSSDTEKGKGKLGDHEVTDQTNTPDKPKSGGITGWFKRKGIGVGTWLFSGVSWLEKRNLERESRVKAIVKGNEEIIEQVKTLTDFIVPQIATIVGTQDLEVGGYLNSSSGSRLLHAYLNSILLQITLNLMECDPPTGRLLKQMGGEPDAARAAMTEYTARLFTHFADPLIEFESEISETADNPDLIKAKFRSLIKNLLKIGFQKPGEETELKQNEIDVMNTNLVKLGGWFNDFLSLSKLENVILPDYLYNFYTVYQKIDNKFGLSTKVNTDSKLGQFVSSLANASVNLAPGLVGDINLLDPREFDFLNSVVTKILRNTHKDGRIDNFKSVLEKYLTSALYQYFFHLTTKDREMSGSIRMFKFDKSKGLIGTLTSLVGESNLSKGLLEKILNDLDDCLTEQHELKKTLEKQLKDGAGDKGDLSNQLQINGLFIKALDGTKWFLENEVKKRLEGIDYLNAHFGKMKQDFIEALLDSRILGGTEAIPFVRAVSKISAEAASNKIRKILSGPEAHEPRKDVFKRTLERLLKAKDPEQIEELRNQIKAIIDIDDEHLRDFVEKHAELGIFKILHFLITVNPEESDKKHLGQFAIEKIGELYAKKSENIQEKMAALFQLFDRLDDAVTSMGSEEWETFYEEFNDLLLGTADAHAATLVSRLEGQKESMTEKDCIKIAQNMIGLVQRSNILDQIDQHDIEDLLNANESEKIAALRKGEYSKDMKAVDQIIEQFSSLLLGGDHRLRDELKKGYSDQLMDQFLELGKDLGKKSHDEIEDYKDEVKLRILRIEVVDMLEDIGIDEELITIQKEEESSDHGLDYNLLSKALFNTIVDFATLNYLYPYYEEIYTPLKLGDRKFREYINESEKIQSDIEKASKAIVGKIWETLSKNDEGKTEQLYADILKVDLKDEKAHENGSAVAWLKTAMDPFLKGEEPRVWEDIDQIAVQIFKYFSARLFKHSPQVGKKMPSDELYDPNFIFKSTAHVFKTVIKDYITKDIVVDKSRDSSEAFYQVVSEKVLELAIKKLDESEKDFPVPDTYSEDLKEIWKEKGPELIEELIGPYLTPAGRNRILMKGLLKANEKLDPNYIPDDLVQRQSDNEHLSLEDSKEILRGLIRKTTDKALRSEINSYWQRWKQIKANFFARHSCLKVFEGLTNLLDAIAIWLFTNLYNYVLPIVFYPLLAMRNKVIEKAVNYISRDEVRYWCEDAILEAFTMFEKDYPYNKKEGGVERAKEELKEELKPAFETLVDDHLDNWYLLPVRKALSYSGINSMIVNSLTDSMQTNLQGQSAFQLTLDGIIEGLA